MGRLIIDGNSVFEVDEECLKRRRVPTYCDIEKYFKKDMMKNSEKKEKRGRPS